MNIHFSGFLLLALSISVVYIGHFLTYKLTWFRLFKKYHIPAPVTAGLFFSLIFSLLSSYHIVSFTFDLHIRDMLLLVFFACVGLSSKLNLLITGGKTFFILLFVMFFFIICQNIIGVSTALALGIEPIKGLLAGSISFVGGHGTAITWNNYFASQGLYPGNQEFGLIAATLGLILGGMLGGPVCHHIIKNHKLRTSKKNFHHYQSSDSSQQEMTYTFTAACMLRVLLEIAITVSLGVYLNSWLTKQGFVFPNFVFVLLVGIFVTNIGDAFRHSSNHNVISIIGEISLDLFVVITLCSLKLNNLANTAVSLLVIATLQSIFIIFFAYYIFFRFAGKDYDAAVITSGFIGSGLGATPVGMANVEAVTHRFGASPKALLIVPLLGSFCSDLMNAVVLQTFLLFPIFH